MRGDELRLFNHHGQLECRRIAVYVGSLLNCSLKIEIIVADNASADNSLVALVVLPNVKVIDSANIAVSKSRLHSQPGALINRFKIMRKGQQVGRSAACWSICKNFRPYQSTQSWSTMPDLISSPSRD